MRAKEEAKAAKSSAKVRASEGGGLEGKCSGTPEDPRPKPWARPKPMPYPSRISTVGAVFDTSGVSGMREEEV